MARQADNQIQPVARPVQAFIEPVRVSVAEPMRPAQLPAFRQPGVVQEGGTPNVQGVNAFETLAGNLEAFNRQLTPVLQAVGLQYADNQMRQGEAEARAAALKGLAQNDASMENAELKHAAANRALAKKDPQAAGIMALLNPYRQIGYERGLAKLAGSKVAIGLPNAIQQRAGEIDYMAPDQGQGQVRRIADEYSSQLMKDAGLTAENPAFQRFVAPEIEKAREKVGLQIAKDRQDYLDTKSIQTTAALLQRTFAIATTKQTIEVDGQVFISSGSAADRKRLNELLQYKMQKIMDQGTLTGALPGQVRERQGKVYAQMVDSGYFKNSGLQLMMQGLPSTDTLNGADGKPLIDPITKTPFYMTLGEVWAKEDLKSEIEMGAARRAANAGKRDEVMNQSWQATDSNGNPTTAPAFETFLWERIGKLPPGAEREAKADAAVSEYWNRYGKDLERTGTTLLTLEKKRKEIGDLKSNLYFEAQPDPGFIERELAELATRRGDKWDARAEYQRGEMIAQHYRDPQEANRARARWTDAVRGFDKENTSMTQYKEGRDSVINQAVNQGLVTNYGPSDPRNQGDRSASRSRQWQAYVPYVNAVLMNEEGKKGSKLTDAEVRRYTTDALAKYGSGPNGADQKAYLFPGSKYSGTPGITPKTKMGAAAGDMGPSRAGPGPTKPQPYSGKVYEINGLDNIPDRKVLLRQYEKLPVLSAPALNQLIDAAAQGKPWPKAFEKAWRDSGAQNGGQFILKQIEKYQDNEGNPVFNLPPELQQKILERAAADAGAGDYLIGLRATQQRFPNLAAVAGAALDLVTGTRPASAATMEGPGGGGVGRNWAASTSNGAALVRVADRLGLNPADMAAIFSFETGGTMSPSEPGRGAAAGRVGLIQAGPNEMRAYGIHGGQTFEQQLEGVARYLQARGAKPGMGLSDLYATVNGGNPGAGWTADGNGTVARSEATQRRLREHRDQAIRRLGLSPRN
jgi:hypothetical protein